MQTEEILAALIGKRVAIVGNATPKRNFGALVDTYDVVVRMNNYVTEGYEQAVGSKTTYRCTTGWTDIKKGQSGIPEFSPFRRDSKESANLGTYEALHSAYVATPITDVHGLIREVPNPSTGFALVQLCVSVGLAVDLFGFDGFKSPHYWNSTNTYTTHKVGEAEYIATRPDVYILGTSTYPYEKLYDFCHSNHSDYDSNVGLAVFGKCGLRPTGLKILELGAGNGKLSSHMASCNNEVTALEVSEEAFNKIPAPVRKMLGGSMELPFMQDGYDLFVSIDVLEHLTEHDIRLTVREAARLCKEMFVCVSTRPSGLLGPNGENLHLTVKPSAWWHDIFSRWWNVTSVRPGPYAQQAIIEGSRK